MKLKLSKDELSLLLNKLEQVDQIQFLTRYESLVTTTIIRKFVSKRLKHLLDLNPESPTLKFKKQEILAIQYILKESGSSDANEVTMLTNLIQQLDVCLKTGQEILG